MKKNFIRFIVADMIRDKGFMPLKDENGNLTVGSGINMLSKDFRGNFVVIDFVDGDAISGEGITARLEHNKNWLLNLKSTKVCYFLEIFLFDSAPEPNKTGAIENGQLQGFMERKHLQCVSVNLSEKSLHKYSKLALPKTGLEKVMENRLEQETGVEAGDIDLEELLKEKQKGYSIDIKAKKPMITYTLIAINALIWLLIEGYARMSGNRVEFLLLIFGAKFNPLILAGEYWRFITPVFLHAGVLHMAVNGYSLYAVGPFVEKVFGHGKFIIIYLCAGVTGNIASFVFSNGWGVGASGAVFGMLGAMLYLGLEKPDFFRRYLKYNIVSAIVINLAYGLSRPGIDNFAHIGGLVGGFLLSGVVSGKIREKWYLNKIFYITITAIIVGSGLFYGFNRA